MRDFLLALIFVKNLAFKGLTFKNRVRILDFAFKRFFLRKKIPFTVLCGLTYDCNCKCVHCYAAKYSTRGGLLSAKEWKEIIDYAAGWGVVKLTFLGGEPLLSEDLVVLVAYASALGLRTSIDTNGELLNEEAVLKLKGAGLSYVNVSIDSVKEEVHDALRNRKGLFHAATEGLRLCVKHGLPCQISIYASHRTIKDGDLEHMAAFGKKLGVSGVKVMKPRLFGRWQGKKEELLDREEELYIDRHIDNRFVFHDPPVTLRNNILRTTAAKGRECLLREFNYLHIAPDGEVQPCPVTPCTIGNVRNSPIRDIMSILISRHSFLRSELLDGKCLVNLDGNCLVNDERFQKLLEQFERFPVHVDELISTQTRLINQKVVK